MAFMINENESERKTRKPENLKCDEFHTASKCIMFLLDQLGIIGSDI